jgi:citrate synthase
MVTACQLKLMKLKLMTINNKLISIDKRYKLTSKDIEEMNVLRGQGKTLEDLSKNFKVSQATVLYWTDKKQRKKQRLKNAKRRKKGLELKKSIEKDTEKRKLRWSIVPQNMWVNRYHSAKGEKRSKRHKIVGVSVSIVEKHKHKFNAPNSKIKLD